MILFVFTDSIVHTAAAAIGAHVEWTARHGALSAGLAHDRGQLRPRPAATSSFASTAAAATRCYLQFYVGQSQKRKAAMDRKEPDIRSTRKACSILPPLVEPPLATFSYCCYAFT